MRTLFDKPIRAGTTLEFYPDKLTLEEFAEEMKSSAGAYAKNMIQIKSDEPRHIEEWVESFLAWCEIEQE